MIAEAGGDPDAVRGSALPSTAGSAPDDPAPCVDGRHAAFEPVTRAGQGTYATPGWIGFRPP